jgi:hypothetical protein
MSLTDGQQRSLIRIEKRWSEIIRAARPAALAAGLPVRSGAWPPGAAGYGY